MLTIEQNRWKKIIPLFTESTLELRFPCGLLGLSKSRTTDSTRFLIFTFLWLEAQGGDGLCFLVVPPPFVVESYHIELTDDDVGFLNLSEPEDAVILNIATFHPDGSITVNLKGPIVHNRLTPW